jgi:hypothetical protein
MSSSIRIGVLYGFRNPAVSGLSFPAMYARVLEQIELVDQLGFDHVWITEHHFVEDGYMPSPLVMSGAIAARTSRVAIGQDVMLLPFTNPVRLAEDLAVLDNLSNGRMMVGAGMGYVPSEFAAMGIPRGERRQRMDETLAILRHAFTEEEFDFHGTHFELQHVRVRPRPVQPGGPPVWSRRWANPALGARRDSMRTCFRRVTGEQSSIPGVPRSLTEGETPRISSRHRSPLRRHRRPCRGRGFERWRRPREGRCRRTDSA